MNREQLINIVLEADKIFFNENYRADVRMKGEADYVTRADIEISEFLHRRLGEEFPEVGFMSEEGDTSIAPERDYFILDPIDGTTNFVHGLPMCGVSLAFWSDGEVKIGVIYIPYTHEVFSGEKGKGAFLNDERIECSKKSRLSDALGLLEFNAYFKNEADSALEQAGEIFTRCLDVRCLGSAAFSLAYVACGRADAFLGRYLKPWDFAAGAVIITEAGGKLSNLDGELTVSKLNQHIVASNSTIFEDFSALFNNK